MAELVREIVIDATPETIWPFLTEKTKHVEWLGTVADIDPRPGGAYSREPYRTMRASVIVGAAASRCSAPSNSNPLRRQNATARGSAFATHNTAGRAPITASRRSWPAPVP